MNGITFSKSNEMFFVIDTKVYSLQEGMTRFPSLCKKLCASQTRMPPGKICGNTYVIGEEQTRLYRVMNLSGIAVHKMCEEQFCGVETVTKYIYKITGCGDGMFKWIPEDWEYLKEMPEVEEPPKVEEPEPAVEEPKVEEEPEPEPTVEEQKVEEPEPEIEEEPAVEAEEEPEISEESESKVSEEPESEVKEPEVEEESSLVEKMVEEMRVPEEEPKKKSRVTILKKIETKSNISGVVLCTPEEAQNTPNEIMHTVITPYMGGAGRAMSSVPIPCRGEAWAVTSKELHIEDVDSDAFCIESNWEKRGAYYIIDCVSRGVRLIHSDAKGFNEEFDLDIC